MLNAINYNRQMTAADRAWLDWLVLDDAQQQADYRLYRDYYNGHHNVPLTDRQKEYLQRQGVDFAFNFLRLPVNVLVQRLNVTGFEAPSPYGGRDGLLWEWWNINRMDALQRAVHRATVVDGDSYVLVEWDSENGRPVFHHEWAYDGEQGVKVTYASSGGRKVAFASRRWRETGDGGKTFRRLNIYTPDYIYKYQSSSETEAGWQPFEDEDGTWPLPWPVGIVPVIHFRHDDDGSEWGYSELENLISPQNALNKSVLDLLEGSDKTAYQIITLKGGKAETLQLNPRQILWHSSPDAAWGHIPAGDIEKLIRLKNDFIVTIAQLSQVPLSYFQITGQIASAETQRADDTGLVSKATSEAVAHGNAWEDVMATAVAMQAAFGGGNGRSLFGQISTVWDTFERVDKMTVETQRAEIVDTLIKAGASLAGALQVAGYTDEEQAILIRGDMVDGIEQ